MTPKVKHPIDEKKAKNSKPTAVLVNIARGLVVISDDLANALNNGIIYYAALEVTDPELIPLDRPLVSLPNYLFASHTIYSS